MATPRMMLVLLGAAALVVGAVAALATGKLWVLFLVLAVHAVASAFVIAFTFKRAGETGGKPDPVTEARLEEEEEPKRRFRREEKADREVFS